VIIGLRELPILKDRRLARKEEAEGTHTTEDTTISTMSGFSFAKIREHFSESGCTKRDCSYGATYTHGHRDALDLHNALFNAGYDLGTGGNHYKGHILCPHRRLRSSKGLVDLITEKIGKPAASGWENKPSWKGIVFFLDHETLHHGHIDLWDGEKGVHKTFPNSPQVLFWKLDD